MKIDRDAFLSLPMDEVAHLVRDAGPKVCVFPINGTRRWYLLEHEQQESVDSAQGYLDALTKRHIELYQLVFDHGIETLLTPIFGPDLLERGEDYVDMAIEGMERLGTHSEFLDFYEAYGVRVRFYGDYQDYLDPAPANRLAHAFQQVTEDTLEHDRCRLFFGVFAHDAVETVAELSVAFYEKEGRVPDRRTLVELYYGEYVPPVDLFIGFDKFSAFDMPLVATGAEDLYFTVAPSAYLTARQLRLILYDHMVVRPEVESDYSDLTQEGQQLMREFYRANVDKTQGIGARKNRRSFWHPLPQVSLPARLQDKS